MKTRTDILEKRIKILLGSLIGLLVFTSLIIFPFETVLGILSNYFEPDTAMGHWIWRVLKGVQYTNIHFSFLSHVYDWLAYFLLVIALALVGPFKEPVRNIWVLKFLFIASIAALVISLLGGSVRNLPVWWRAFEILFILINIILLRYCWKMVKELEMQVKRTNILL